MDNATRREIHAAGERATSPDECPYPPGTPERVAWMDGYHRERDR